MTLLIDALLGRARLEPAVPKLPKRKRHQADLFGEGVA